MSNMNKLKRKLLAEVTELMRETYEDHDKGELIDLLMSYHLDGPFNKPLKKMDAGELAHELDALESQMENR